MEETHQPHLVLLSLTGQTEISIADCPRADENVMVEEKEKELWCLEFKSLVGLLVWLCASS